MKKEMLLTAGRLWLESGVLFALRLVQLRTGFEPDTRLAVPGAPAGLAMGIALLLCLAVEGLLCLRRQRGGKRSYACCFDPPEGPVLGGLAAGSLLLLAGGTLLLIRVLPPQGTAAITAAIAGALGIAGGAGLLLLVRTLRRGETPSAFPLLPGMYFSVLFVLAVFFPAESDPVLERFCIPVLGAALGAYFFYQLAGFTHREGNPRWMCLTGGAAVLTCTAAAADCLGEPCGLLIYLGYALTATVFLLLLRREPLPEQPLEGTGVSPAEEA